MSWIKYSKAEKSAISTLSKGDQHSTADIIAKFQLILEQLEIRNWKRRYELNGEDGLTDTTS